MALRPFHFAANILDPYQKGKHLTPEKYAQGLLVISEIACKLGIDEHVAIEDFAKFSAENGFWSQPFVIDAATKLPVTL